MANTTINIRIDETTKQGLEEVCKDLGMNTTTAFTIFAKKVVRERRIPFDVSIDPFYSEEKTPNAVTEAAMLEARAKAAGLIPDTSPKFDNVDDLFEYLEKD